DIVLNGHRHVYSIHGVEDALIISTGTLSHFKTRGYHGRSYNLIKVSDKGVRVIVRRLDIDHKEEYIKKARRVERLVQVKLPRIARVIQISDTYFMGDGLFDRRVYDVATTIINRLKPDVVAHCGNITEDGMHETFEEAEKLLKKVKTPLIAVPGPHDLMNIGDLVFEDYVGGLNPLFQNENIIIVGVNSSQRDYTGGVIGRKNLERILGKLNKAGKKTVKLVAFHHHLMPLPYVREEEVLEDTADVLRNMIGNADIVLTGDRSISSCLMVDGCLVINSGTLCRKQYQDPYGNSFNLIDIFANRTVMVSEFSIPAGSKRVLGTYLIRSGVSDIERGTKK
ncbi:MAG: metallophosphoesterase family protein, partial [Promethearchaeota archaeon]